MVTMVEPCPRCGIAHEGDCPDSAPASQVGAAEACPYCGELHPPSVKCGEWAKQTGTGSTDTWSSAGLSALPPLPKVTFQPRPPKPQKRSLHPIVLRVAVVAFAVFGAAVLVWIVAGRLTGGSGTT